MDDRPAPTVELRLLGGLELRRGGVPVTGFRSRKALLLLAYLAVRGTPQTRAWLTELFWPDATSERGRAELARVLNDLKTRVGPVLVADRQRVGLVDGAVVDDLSPLAAADRGGGLSEVAAAVAEGPGPFLAGVEVGEPELSDWVDEQRHRVEVLLGELLERLCRAAADDEEALAWARRWAAHDDLDEAAARTVIELLVRTGRPAAALAHYADLEERLARELGVEPDPRTRELARALREAPAPASLPVPGLPALPPTWTPLLGRDELVAQVGRRVLQPHTRLVTLTGPGGVGKTRVALEAARRAREAGSFDGVGFVDLTAVRRSGLVDDALQRQLALVAGPDLRLALRRQLGRGRVLLVLDNVEQIHGMAEHVLGLLTELPALVVLTTSRGTLQLLGEQLVEVPPLELDDAVRLFEQQAEAGGAGARLRGTPGSDAAVRALCAQLDGLPLGLELAAIGLRTVDLGELGRRLATGGDGVGATERNRPARHRTVHDTVRWSVELLTPEQQHAFAWSAAFVAPVRPARLAELTGVRRTESESALRAMSQVGLLRPERSGTAPGAAPAAPVPAAGTRFGMLPLVRSVAARDLRASAAQPAAHRRHAELYLRLARGTSRRGVDADGRDQLDRLLELESEIDEVRVALERAAGRSNVELARWCRELRVFCQVCGHIGEALDWAEQVLAVPDGLDPVAYGWVLVLAEWACIRTGNLARSHALHEQLVPVVARSRDDDLAIYAASTGAGYALHTGRLAEAVRLGEEVAARADRRGLLEVQLNQRSALGFVAQVAGQGERAVAVAREGVELSVRFQDVQWRTVLQSVLGAGLLMQGDPSGAIGVYADALQQIARTGDTYLARPCLISAAEVTAALGRLDESARLVGAVVGLDAAVGEYPGVYGAIRDRLSTDLPGRLGAEAYAGEVAAGRRLELADAARLVRSIADDANPPRVPTGT